MKTVSKKLSLILAAITAAGSLSACSDSPSSSTASEPSASESSAASASSAESGGEEGAAGVTYPLEGNPTFTYAIGEEAAVTVNATDLGATPFGQAWQEATGVTLEIQHPSGNDGFNLLFASGDLPDIINWKFTTYSGGPTKAIKDGIIYPIEDLIEENAPDLKAVLDSNDLYRKSTTSVDGHIVGFPFIRGSEYLLTAAGMVIRDDWLDELGLEKPQTPDELYEVLVAFRDEKGATIPATGELNTILGHWVNYGMITSGFGLVKGDFYQVDNVVHYGRAEQEYKDVLAYLNRLYEEKLLDQNFNTINSSTKDSNLMNGLSGVSGASVGGGIGNYLQTMEGKDFSITGFGPLVAKEGDKAKSTYYDNPVTGHMAVITPNCENKEAAAQFLNYGYTEEGHMLFNFGIEGESYTMVDGVPTYTELITHNPDGWTMQQALAQYTRSWATDAFVQDEGYMRQYGARPQQQEALESWTNTDAAKYAFPPTTIAEENSAEYSKLWSDLITYMDEMFVKFVTGVEPLDKFETDYLPMLEQLGIDRVLELQQNALDEFNAR